jgi:hypothetical protein
VSDITVHISGDDEFERKVRKLQLFFDDLRTFWPLLVPVFIGWLGAQFSTEGGWGGQTWAPLSPQYAVWKGTHYPGRTILIRDGALRRAASEPRREATPRTLTLWIDDDVAGYHQDGTDRMPARPLIPENLPQSALRDIDEAAHVYVSTLVRQLSL